VRLVAIKTDVAKRYIALVPPLPVPPFNAWRNWFKRHQEAVHCAVEWCDEQGNWFHGELRSPQFTPKSESYRVGWGEFPGTGYDAYGVYIVPGRIARDHDEKGRPLTVTLDEELQADYRQLERELRSYAAKFARSGSKGTGGRGEQNVGLGGPVYKPSQNSNTMISYILKRCGVNRPAPDLAVGWNTTPRFPYSSDADAPPLDSQP
jgi:hypothetical protein